MKVAHIYACKAKRNSGDFLIGNATKMRFSQMVNEKVTFVNFDVRNPEFTNKTVLKLNKEYDAIIVGAGGLILPDTSAAQGSPSGWQWRINLSNLNNISIPIYVIAIGYNTFFEQKMGMTNKHNNKIDHIKYKSFVNHIGLLVKKSVYFSMRHTRDIEKLLNDIGNSYKDKIKFEYCPTIEYTKNKNLKSDSRFIAFEIKDDRLWRRCYKIGKAAYYAQLTKTIDTLIKNGERVAFLSHDGSSRFYKHLKQKGYRLPKIDNSIGNEDQIYNNYCKIKTLVCTAGHSQMIGSAIKGIKVISLITHPKLINFCRDSGDTNYIMPNKSYGFSKELLHKINE